MRRRILDVRADREAGGVRLVVDGVAELRGLDERLAALLCGADGGLPSAPVRAFALLKPFQRRLARALSQCRIDALLVDLIKEYNELTDSLFGTKQSLASLVMDAIPALLESNISLYNGSIDEYGFMTYIGNDGRKKRLKLTSEQLEKLKHVEDFVYGYEAMRYESHQ